MKKHHIVNKPIRRSDLTFDDLYEDISDEWEAKAARLQARRWRKLKHQLI
jgi:hypothetical protein